MEKSSKMKLGFAIAILLVLIVAMNPVSSFSFFGFGDNYETVNVGGIDFNIPEEYSYNAEYTNIMYQVASDDFFYNNGEVKSYTSDSGNITILVSDSQAEDVSALVDNGYTAKTVNGNDGIIEYLPEYDEYMFCFVKDGKMAGVYVSDEAILEDIIT